MMNIVTALDYHLHPRIAGWRVIMMSDDEGEGSSFAITCCTMWTNIFTVGHFPDLLCLSLSLSPSDLFTPRKVLMRISQENNSF